MTLLAFLPVVVSSIAAGVDLRRREIPDVLPLSLFLVTVLLALLNVIPTDWTSRFLGLGLTLILTLPGFQRNALGGGDVKLLAALAFWFGLAGTIGILFWTAITGSVLAVISGLCGRRDLAFAPAIAVATIIQVLAPQALSWLIDLIRLGLP